MVRRSVTSSALVVFTLALLGAHAPAVHAGADTALRCATDKMLRAGVYDLCRLKLTARALRHGTTPDLSRCDAKLSTTWAKAEQKAGGACPTSGDEATIRTLLQQHTDAVEAALLPPPPLLACGAASFPGCGGSCPTGDSCWAAVEPGPTTLCACLPASSTPCASTGGFTAPQCGGMCPSGEVCATLDVTEALEFSCACIPESSTPCLSTSQPTCGGSCPAGLSCAPDALGLFSCKCQ